VLCELLEAEGADELWSDCGIADELELLLEGEVLCGLLEGELLVEELPFTDELDWLLVAGLVD
jgi:hypothetical protein